MPRIVLKALLKRFCAQDPSASNYGTYGTYANIIFINKIFKSLHRTLENCDSDYGDDTLSQYSLATSQTPSFRVSSFLYSKPDESPINLSRRGSLHERQPSLSRQSSVSRFQNKYKTLDMDDDDIASQASSSRYGKYSSTSNALG